MLPPGTALLQALTRAAPARWTAFARAIARRCLRCWPPPWGSQRSGCAILLRLDIMRRCVCLPKVYGISTEDMDSLTFGTPKLIRHLMAPVSQKQNAMEFDHAQVGARAARGGTPLCDRVHGWRVGTHYSRAEHRTGHGASTRRQLLLVACLAPCRGASLPLLST